MSFENITLFAAFFAGLLSFISPCVLPLIPVYLGYLSGSTIVGDIPPPRRLVFSHALLFVGGFTFIDRHGVINQIITGPINKAVIQQKLTEL